MNPFILPNPRTTSKNTDVYNAFRSTPKPKLRARLGGHQGAGVAPKVHHATHQCGLHRLEEQEVGGWVGPPPTLEVEKEGEEHGGTGLEVGVKFAS